MKGERIAGWLEAAVFRGLQILVLLAPLPLASNRLWAWSLWGCMLSLLLAVWLCGQVVRGRRPVVFSAPLALAGICITGTIAVIAFQATCGVPQWLAHPDWARLSVLPDGSACGSVSLSPAATWTALARLLSYVAAFWLALQIARRPERAQALMKTIAFSGTLYAAWGLVWYFAKDKPVLFFEEHRFTRVLTSTFVNRNTFAAYAGIAAVLNAAMVLDRLFVEVRDRSTNLLRLLLEVCAERALLLAGLVICLTAVVLTASRAGFGATVLGFVVLVIALSVHHRRALRSVTTPMMVAAVFMAVIVGLGGSTLVSRLDQIDESWSLRGTVIAGTMEASMDRPWLGVGYGTFEEAWPAYRPDSVVMWFRQAHDTYAENAFELGYPAAIALMVSVFILLWMCARGTLRRRRDGLYPSAALAGLAIPICHSTVDFSLQIPAIVLTAAVLLGLGVGQSFSSSRRESRGASAAPQEHTTG